MFKTLSEFKTQAEKFKAGTIIPSRVFVVHPKKVRHLVVFTCDVFRVRSQNGYDVFFCDFDTTKKPSETEPSYTFGPIHIKNGPRLKGICIQGETHGKMGNKFYGNKGITEEECLAMINRAVFCPEESGS